MNTLFSRYISGHEFDRQVENYFSALASSDVDYLYSYSLPCNNPSLKITFDNSKYLSRISVWASGECDIEVVSFANSRHVIDETCEVRNIGEFEDKLLSLVDYMKSSTRLH